jgi:hypothetical protein
MAAPAFNRCLILGLPARRALGRGEWHAALSGVKNGGPLSYFRRRDAAKL